jgi:hypothetical protein
MRTTAPAGRINQSTLTVLGVITLVAGVSYAVFGGLLLFAGTSWFTEAREDPWQEIAGLFGIGAAIVIIVGLVFLSAGILGLLGGLGVVLRKEWGRVLTFILAVLAILFGLLWLVGSDQDAPAIAVGAAQLLYGILAFVILIRLGAEFSRPRL